MPKKHENNLKPSTLVLSVGGSIVAPKTGIDQKFLCAFKKLIEAQTKRKWKFVIVIGGGATARAYQEAAKGVGNLHRDDLDWLGIHSTRLNGHLMRTVFRDIAHHEMFNDPTRVPKTWNKKVLVAAGWKPGWSTDYVATRIAKRLGVKLVVNLSNIDYLYTKDPNKHKDAEVICNINWKDFRKIVGSKWDPGMNVPFDPVASKLADESGITVALLNGTNLSNLNALLSGKNFQGTIVRP
ncbi:UMP kinase [Patescibacteria group bacterium]